MAEEKACQEFTIQIKITNGIASFADITQALTAMFPNVDVNPVRA